jgi:7-cyano-7-deazaguanine synthase in queuosine biosynthesis
MNNCPECGHDLVNIFYGMPSFKLIEMAKSEDIALGGTSSDPMRPTHYCYGCGEEFLF